jgi:hypothetical protein
MPASGRDLLAIALGGLYRLATVTPARLFPATTR